MVQRGPRGPRRPLNGAAASRPLSVGAGRAAQQRLQPTPLSPVGARPGQPRMATPPMGRGRSPPVKVVPSGMVAAATYVRNLELPRGRGEGPGTPPSRGQTGRRFGRGQPDHAAQSSGSHITGGMLPGREGRGVVRGMAGGDRSRSRSQLVLSAGLWPIDKLTNRPVDGKTGTYRFPACSRMETITTMMAAWRISRTASRVRAFRRAIAARPMEMERKNIKNTV